MSTPDPLATLRKELANPNRLSTVEKGTKGANWRFKSYGRLLKKLGHTDGIAEVMEVAARDFLDEAARSGRPQEYLKSRAYSQGIVAYELDVENIPRRAAELYIVGAYQQLEAFLYDVVSEYDSFTGEASRRRLDEEAPMDWVLSVLPGGFQRNRQRIWRERYLTLEYYRQVRNMFSHPQKAKASVTAAYRQAEHFTPILQADYGLSAPNDPDSLTFDDFLLFTRLIKYLGTDLNRICEPSPMEFAAYAKRAVANRDLSFLSLPTERLNPEKRRKRIGNIFAARFGRSPNAAVLDDIAKDLA